MRKLRKAALLLFCASSLTFAGCGAVEVSFYEETGQSESIDVAEVPEYTEEAYAVVNNNVPGFSEEDMTTEVFEEYSELDELGRCGEAYANICEELMPTEERGNISAVKPTGWHSVEYDFVDGDHLYNRCHLIGFQLAGENANECNLITGTRYCNVEGMLPFENMIADFVKETGYHVLYRVTPIYEGDNLVASGVQMEAKSVEDDGEGIEFNVYCYNVQPGVEIDYATGDSWEADIVSTAGSGDEKTYVLNTNSKKIHTPDCSSVTSMKEANKKEYTGDVELLMKQGYEKCGSCNP